MAWPKGKPRPARAGRRAGTKNKRTLEVEAYAKSIVEDPAVQKTLLTQAKQGTLPPAVMQLFFYYAYGKPVERIEQSGPDGGPMEVVLTEQDRKARIAELNAKLQG